VNLKTKIMALKIFKPLECGGMPVGNITTAADSAEAIIYAASNRAKVINASWGGRKESLVIKSAIGVANLAGVLFVAAAGNDGTDNDTTPHYPSSHSTSQPNVIAVAATDHNDNLASFSNFGKLSVQLGAPGVEILSSVLDNDYAKMNGTSMATPHVAGAAALVWARHPSLNHLQVKECILRKVDPKPALANKVGTGGRLNLHRAVLCNPLAQKPADNGTTASGRMADLPSGLRNAAQLELLGRYARTKIGLYYVMLLMPVLFILGWRISVRKSQAPRDICGERRTGA
jgi:subtilisin family serine protease